MKSGSQPISGVAAILSWSLTCFTRISLCQLSLPSAFRLPLVPLFVLSQTFLAVLRQCSSCLKVSLSKIRTPIFLMQPILRLGHARKPVLCGINVASLPSENVTDAQTRQWFHPMFFSLGKLVNDGAVAVDSWLNLGSVILAHLEQSKLFTELSTYKT